MGVFLCPNFISQKVKVSSSIHLNTCKYHVCGIKHETKEMPLSKAWDSRTNVLFYYFCFVHIVRGKYRGFDILRQTWQCNVITDCEEELPWFYQLAVPTND